jgi:hypothetical protein
MGIFDSYDNPVIYPPSGPKYPHIPQFEARSPWMSKPSPRMEGNTIYWYFGDVIHLPIEVKGQMYLVDEKIWIDIEDFLVGKTVVVTLVDFRGNKLYEQEHKDIESNVVNFVLEENDSKQVSKGSYSLRLAVYGLNGELIKILIGDSQYTIVVE